MLLVFVEWAKRSYFQRLKSAHVLFHQMCPRLATPRPPRLVIDPRPDLLGALEPSEASSRSVAEALCLLPGRFYTTSSFWVLFPGYLILNISAMDPFERSNTPVWKRLHSLVFDSLLQPYSAQRASRRRRILHLHSKSKREMGESMPELDDRNARLAFEMNTAFAG